MKSRPPRYNKDHSSETLKTALPRKSSENSLESSRSRAKSQQNTFRDDGDRCPDYEDQIIDEDPPAVLNAHESKYLIFRPFSSGQRPPPPPNRGYFFKFLNNSDVRLVRWFLEDNGFREGRKDWLVLWSCGAMRSQIYQSLTRWQRVNHFPRSHEITRKDNLIKNFTRMQSIHGKKHFDFVPETYILPQEMHLLSEAMDTYKSDLWIFKPVGGSQGRGIYLTNKLSDLPSGQAMVASRYISNPLLIDGFKFDLRIYVAVTSMDPLRIYIYKEGLVRFATEKYDTSTYRNVFVHLTNYSLNKYNPNFLNTDEDGMGSKWSLTAFKEFVNKHGLNFAGLWEDIKDICLKTIISMETIVNAACKMYVPNRNNCFELLGFDILIDNSLKPWLLEVNLSPSLNIDANIDLRIKGKLLADLLNLVGIPSHEWRDRPKARGGRPNWNEPSPGELSTLERQVIRETEQEMTRLGSFERIFPCENASLYKSLFDTERPLNTLLFNQFAPSRSSRNASRALESNGERGRSSSIRQGLKLGKNVGSILRPK